MSETVRLILSIWITAIFIIFYIIHRINWANESIDRIMQVVLYYRKTMADEGVHDLNEYGDRGKAINTLVFLDTTTDTDMILKLIGGNKQFKNSNNLYMFKAVIKPWLNNTTKSICNKALWTLMNNKIFGEGEWS
ncbi:MAG: hypothetical protein KAT05_14740 [Spirochaetes bacterium]|nr:hypothetical protein [Spirochaetota bacterium]